MAVPSLPKAATKGKTNPGEREDLVQDAGLAKRSNAKPAQGPAAPGGAHSYLVSGHMIAGHAMSPGRAANGDSGVETFVCGQNGAVHQKDLRPNTVAIGTAMTQYNPDSTWTPVE
jgi:Protein of unknown function (DUF2950)